MAAHTWVGTRTLLGYHDHITLLGWPSRGGIIMLQSASIADFEFLGLDCRKPHLQSAAGQNQDTEDQFCQQLLLLGANWFDSQARHVWLERVKDGDEEACDELEMGRVPEPTFSERRWVRVGWPCAGTDAPGGLPHGGFWVAEYDIGMNYGEKEWDEQRLPDELPGLLLLCKDMQERCEVLQAFGAKFYERLEDYDGSGFLKAWQEKHYGEVGPLVKTNGFRAPTPRRLCGGTAQCGKRN